MDIDKLLVLNFLIIKFLDLDFLYNVIVWGLL